MQSYRRKNRFLLLLLSCSIFYPAGSFAAPIPALNAPTHPELAMTDPEALSGMIEITGDQPGGLGLLASTEFTNIGENIEMRVRVSGFINIRIFRFSMTWDATDLQYLNLLNFNAGVTGLDIADFDISQAGAGILTLDWNNPTGVTVPDNDILFRIRFNVLDGPGNFPVVFGDDPVAIFAQQAFPPFPVIVMPTDGAIVVGDCTSPLAAMSCEDAPLLCAGELDGYCGHTGPDEGLTVPPGFCGSIENGEWISFVAGSAAMTLRVNTGNCTGSPIGSGLQVMAFYTDDCNNFTPISGCITQIEEFNTFDLMMSGMTPGLIYYILFDGYGGDMCDYTLEVISGSVAPPIDPPGAITGASSLCEESTQVPYSISPVAGALGYVWTVPPGAFVNGSGTSITVDFGTESGQVCVRAYDACDTTAASCVEVTLNPAVTIVDFVSICTGECYTYNGNNYCNPGTYQIPLGSGSTCDTVLQLHLSNYPAATSDLTVAICPGECLSFMGNTWCTPGDYEAVVPGASAQGCDSIIQVHLTQIVVPIQEIDTLICQGSTLDFHGESFTTAGTYQVLLENASYQSCDSIVELHIQILDMNINMQAPDIITCTMPIVSVSADVTTQPPGQPVSYVWLNNLNMIIGNTTSVPVSNAGTYILQASVTADGITCTESAQVQVMEDITLPDPLIVSGPLSTCINETQIYQATIDNSLTSYQWSVSGGNIVSGQGSSEITVSWLNTATAQVCVSPVNACGMGQSTCLDITLNGAVLTGPVTGSSFVCPNGVENYSVLPALGIVTYDWTVPPGALILTGQNTPVINIDWNGSAGGNVCMTPETACEIGQPICLQVDVISENTTVDIAGDTSLCVGTTAGYSFAGSGTGFSYQWSVPLGGMIVSGQGTPEVDVNWTNSPGGQVCLEVQTQCLTLPLVCETVLVNTAPQAVNIQGNLTVCNGIPEIYFVPQVANVTSYVWELPSNASFTGQGTQQIETVWSGNDDGPVCVTMTNACGTGLPNCIDIEVVDLPETPVISGNTAVCSGSEAVYFLDNASAYDSMYWSLPAGAIALGPLNEASMQILWDSGSGGDLCVQAWSGCASSVSECYTVNVTQTPTPEAGDDQVVCGLSTNLSATGDNGIWTYTSASGGSLLFDNINEPSSFVTATTAGIYTLYWNISNNPCSAIDSVEISFGDQPQIIWSIDSCSNDLTTYHVIFEVSGGASPYLIATGFGGTFAGNVFTSVGIPSGFDYFFVVQDAGGCQSAPLAGNHVCNCESQAGTLNTDPIDVCTYETATVISQGDYQLDLSDTLVYLLHDGDATTVGTVLGTSNNGQFNFNQAVMVAGQTYYVHLAVGNDAGNGMVDPGDICYSISALGVPVTFYAPPQGALLGGGEICPGDTIVITFQLTGQFPITLVYSANGEPQNPIIATTSPFQLPVTPSETTVYAIFSLTDNSPALCASGGGNQIEIGVIGSMPLADAGDDIFSCTGTAQLNAILPAGTMGLWTSLGSAVVGNPANPSSPVGLLMPGANDLVWTVSDILCDELIDSDTVTVYYSLDQTIQDDSFFTLRNQLLEGDVSLNDELTAGSEWLFQVLEFPASGELDFDPQGAFAYTPDGVFAGVVSFVYEVCSAACPDICDTATAVIGIGLEPFQLDSTLIIPNGITPNGDGANETFYIENLEYFPDNDIIIFNRWGDIVFKAKPYLNDWTGTNQQGKPMPDGTYYYVLRLLIGDGDMYKGDITILRQ